MTDPFYTESEETEKEFPPVTYWGEYKGYKVWHNPPHGYAVIKEDYRINKQKFSTPKETQVFIDKLPPHPSYKETLMKITGHPFER